MVIVVSKSKVVSKIYKHNKETKEGKEESSNNQSVSLHTSTKYRDPDPKETGP